MEFITLAEYKAFAEISSPNQDSKLAGKIAFVNNYVTNYLGILDSYTIEYTGDSPVLLESTLPIASLTLVNPSTFEETLLTTGFLQVGYKLYTKSTDYGIYKITTDTSAYVVPPAVKEACFQLIKYYLKEEYKTQQQAGSEQVQTTEPTSLPMHVKNILDLYREV